MHQSDQNADPDEQRSPVLHRYEKQRVPGAPQPPPVGPGASVQPPAHNPNDGSRQGGGNDLRPNMRRVVTRPTDAIDDQLGKEQASHPDETSENTPPTPDDHDPAPECRFLLRCHCNIALHQCQPAATDSLLLFSIG